jgi:hypothetical protein
LALDRRMEGRMLMWHTLSARKRPLSKQPYAQPSLGNGCVKSCPLLGSGRSTEQRKVVFSSVRVCANKL